MSRIQWFELQCKAAHTCPLPRYSYRQGLCHHSRIYVLAMAGVESEFLGMIDVDVSLKFKIQINLKAPTNNLMIQERNQGVDLGITAKRRGIRG